MTIDAVLIEKSLKKITLYLLVEQSVNNARKNEYMVIATQITYLIHLVISFYFLLFVIIALNRYNNVSGVLAK